jgi:hypothetical protein
MLRLTMQRGLLVDFAELRSGIEKLEPEDYEKCSYYERWAKSLAHALLIKGVVSEDALQQKVSEIRQRQAAGEAE